MADLLIDTVVEILAEEAQDHVLLEEAQQTELLEVERRAASKARQGLRAARPRRRWAPPRSAGIAL